MDDILLMRNDAKMLGDKKAWFSMQLSMKDLGDTSYILGIKIYRDRSRRILGITQASYRESLEEVQDRKLETRVPSHETRAWKSSKQDTIIDSTTDAEYIAAFKAAKEVVWMKNYIQELDVVLSIANP
ncbi:UNVERIFIED_CONTAM: hypothetical protein Sradi_6422700 [Sesamum radiatum]|uniref:Reverse transcriptase Ty1/copia-type domain-containing protein n=1 Tax=Sesamum radiatum TaxID=300843 RepID=A0AAW2K3W7_SESRA